MKKLLSILVTLVSMSLVGCSKTNYDMSESYHSYKHIHLESGDKYIHDDVISYSYDYDGTIVEVNTKTYGWVLMSTGYMLYNSDKCPLCNK